MDGGVLGARVGLCVGPNEGRNDTGEYVGVRDGDTDGASVGEIVGDSDGVKLGARDGLRLYGATVTSSVMIARLWQVSDVTELHCVVMQAALPSVSDIVLSTGAKLRPVISIATEPVNGRFPPMLDTTGAEQSRRTSQLQWRYHECHPRPFKCYYELCIAITDTLKSIFPYVPSKLNMSDAIAEPTADSTVTEAVGRLGQRGATKAHASAVSASTIAGAVTFGREHDAVLFWGGIPTAVQRR